MHPAKLKQLEERLYSQMPLIGGCLRQRTAQALARDGSPDAVRALAKTIARSDDRQVLAIALDALRQIRKQQCMEQVCAVWAVTRHKDLANLLIKKGWVASAPVDVRVLSALKAGHLDVVTQGGAEIVEPLLKAFSDADSEIASRASQCAIVLSNPDAIDYLCERWSKTRNRLLEQLILQGKYVAGKPIEVRVLSALKVERLEVITKGGKEVVEPLIKALTDNEREIARLADRCITALKNPDAVDYLCERWLQTRNQHLEQAIVQQRYVARKPIEVRVLSALKVGQRSLVVEGGAEIVEPLLTAFSDEDRGIVSCAKHCASDLKKLEAQESLCRLVIEQDHQIARQIAINAQYTPRDSNQRALFYFLTEQWDKYESLDFEHTLLQAAYQVGDEQLRQRIAQKVRQAGRAEWVKVLVGGHQRKRLGEMTDAEWETALRVLNSGRKWEEMWQLAQAAPPIWSMRLLRQLKDAGWVPKTEFADLVQMGQKCVADVPLNSSWYCQAILHGHSDLIPCLGISPDGKLLASGGSYDNTVRLWSLPDGKPLQTLSGHSNSVFCLGISPDGKLLVSGSHDNTVRLWSLPDGKLLQTLSEHSNWVFRLAISPDSKLLVSGSYDNTVRLWSLPDGKLLQTLSGVFCLAISPDGNLLASGSNDNTVRLWSLPDGKLLQTLSGHTKAIRCLAISPDGKLLANGNSDNTVRLWSLPDGKLLQTLSGIAIMSFV